MRWGPGGFDYFKTLLRLVDYQPHALMEEYHGEWRDSLFYSHEYRYRITAAGRAYYEQEWQRYHELYPDVEAPEPSTNTPEGSTHERS